MKRFFVVLILALLTLSSTELLSGKKPLFKVLALNGKISVIKDGSSWKKLSTKTGLNAKDKLKLGDGAYLGLVHSSGRTAELTKPGEYSIADLAKKVSKKEDNLSKRLTNYVIDEIGGADDLLASDDYHNSMDITGSVERGLELNNNALNKEGREGLLYPHNGFLGIHSPKKTSLINSEVIFAWPPLKGQEKYIFNLHDRFNREILRKEISDTLLKINLYEYNLEKEKYYFWNISLPNRSDVKSDECAFLIFSDDKVTEVNQGLSELKVNMADPPGALDRIVLAAFFEKNGLYNEAKEQYEKALDLVPEVDDFQKLYKTFLYKMHTGN